MSHASIRLLLHDVAKSLADKVQFGYGRKSEFNMIQGPTYPYIWLLPLTAGGSFRDNPNNLTRTKRWNVAILFLGNDESDANADHSAHVLDDMDVLLSRFTHTLDDWYLREADTFGTFTIENDNQTPFYKDNADIQTGWLLTFQMVVSDDFDYCSPENVELYAGNI